MATKKQVEKSMQDAFAGIDDLKNNLATRVAEINKERNDYVNSEAIKVVSEDYLRNHFRDYDDYILDGGTREDFVEQKLSLEQKLDIITEYNINKQLLEGDNSIEANLNDIAGRKKDNKSQYKEEALDLVGMYEKVLQDNETRINTLKQDIEKTKAQISDAEKQLQNVMGKDDETIALSGRLSGKLDKNKAIEELNKHIDGLRKKLTTQEKQLEDFTRLQSKMESEFKARKAEIETFLKAQNIYAFREAPEVSSTNSDEVTKENSGNDKKDETKSMVALTPKKVAKSMFNDFRTSSPERQRKLLMRNGSEDIVKMARYLGPIDRREFGRIMKQRINELPNDVISFNGVSITKEELSNMKKMPDQKLKAIRQEIDRFNGDFENKTIDEISEFEDKLKYVRAGALISETSGLFRGIRRFFDRFSEKGTSIYELSKSAAKYATLKEERTVKKEAMLDRLRVKVSRGKMDEYAHTSTKDLDRTGADDFSR